MSHCTKCDDEFSNRYVWQLSESGPRGIVRSPRSFIFLRCKNPVLLDPETQEEEETVYYNFDERVKQASVGQLEYDLREEIY